MTGDILLNLESEEREKVPIPFKSVAQSYYTCGSVEFQGSLRKIGTVRTMQNLYTMHFTFTPSGVSCMLSTIYVGGR